MKKFEILQELPKYDTETQNEQMLLGERSQQTYSTYSHHKPSIFKLHSICEAQ